MASFKDKAGREWVIDLTVGDLKAIRLATGVEFTAGGGASLYDQIGRLAADFDLMGKAVWALVADQARERGVTIDDFEKALNKATIRASALALMDGFIDFFHPGTAAEAMKAAVREVTETAEAAAGEKIVEAMRRASRSSGSAGSTPASPGSTPGG